MALMSLDPSVLGTFRPWQEALAALEHAEVHDAPHAELVALSEDVIRARNEFAEGVTLGDVARLLADEQLLSERDDTSGPAPFLTPGAKRTRW